MAEDGPCGKICNGLVAMLCGIALLPLSLVLLGWNESHYVCEQKKILYADAKAVQIGCSNQDLSAAGTFAFFSSCPFVSNTLQTFDHCTWGGNAEEQAFEWREEASLARALSSSLAATSGCSSLPQVGFASVSGKRLVEVNQCKESCSTKTVKDSMGRDVEKKECDYNLEWTSTSISVDSFYDKALARRQCRGLGSVNPTPPSWLSMGAQTKFATGPVVGATSYSNPSSGFKLNSGLVQQLDASEMVTYHLLEPTQFRQTNDCNYLGCVRIKYYKSPSTTPSVFTRVSSGGMTSGEPVPGSWGCAASDWQAIFPDPMVKSDAIAALHAANSTLAWVLRVLGLVLAIASIFLCLQPIAAAAAVVGDCINVIPCGGYVKDMIEGLTCIILCPISTAVGCGCGLFVIFTMWLFMRPLIACAGFLAVGLLCTAGAVIHRAGKRSSRWGRDDADLEMPVNANQPGAWPPAMQAVPSQPVAIAQAVPAAVAPPAQSTMMVACPAGCGPGTLLQIQTPDGGQMQVAVPDGVGPGMQFEVRY